LLQSILNSSLSLIYPRNYPFSRPLFALKDQDKQSVTAGQKKREGICIAGRAATK
jgi:hypothetical protein